MTSPYATAGERAVRGLCAGISAAVFTPAPPVRLHARLSFRQWADAVDSGHMPVIRAVLRDTADIVGAVINRRGSR